MAKYDRCPTCGNTEKGYKILKCSKCGNIGCYKDNYFPAFDKPGCIRDIDKCSICGNYGLTLFGALGPHQTLGKIS